MVDIIASGKTITISTNDIGVPLSIGDKNVNIATSRHSRRDDLMIVFGGQSNAGNDENPGRVSYSLIPDYLKPEMPNVYQYNRFTGEFDVFTQSPDLSWGYVNQMLYSLTPYYDRIFWAKWGQGGAFLCPSPVVGGTYSRSLFKMIGNAALTKLNTISLNYDLFGFWQQGESDATEIPCSQAYESNLRAWFAEIRSEVSPVNKIIYSPLADSQPYTYLTTVQAAQAAVSNDSTDNLFMNNMSNITTFDNQHYDASSCVLLGQRYAEKLLENI